MHVCELIRLDYAQRERRLARWRWRWNLRLEQFSSHALILDRSCDIFLSTIAGKSYNPNFRRLSCLTGEA